MSPCLWVADYHYITETSLFRMETALLEAASNSTEMTHMFLARRTSTHSSVSSQRVSLAEAGGIAQLGPDLKSQHAPFPLEILIDGNQTKTHRRLQPSRASRSAFLECDVVRDIASSRFSFSD